MDDAVLVLVGDGAGVLVSGAVGVLVAGGADVTTTVAVAALVNALCGRAHGTSPGVAAQAVVAAHRLVTARSVVRVTRAPRRSPGIGRWERIGHQASSPPDRGRDRCRAAMINIVAGVDQEHKKARGGQRVAPQGPTSLASGHGDVRLSYYKGVKELNQAPRREEVSGHRGARVIVAATVLVSASIGLSIGALGPTLPVLHGRLHAPLDGLGLLFGANFAGSLVATLAAGPLLDRRPARPLLVTGVACMMLGLVLLPLATSLPQAIMALALAGLGSGTNSIGAAVLTARLFGGRGGRALSLINMGFGLGAFIGPLVAAAVLNAVHDYRPIFVGIAATLLVPLVVYTLQPMPGPAGDHAVAGRISRRAWRSVALLAGVTFVYLGAEIGFGGWIYTYLRQTTTVSVTTASWATASYWLALSVSSLAAAVRPRRIAAEPLVLWCATASALVALAVLLGRGNIGLELASAAALGLFLGPIYPLSMASGAGLVATAAGRVAALVIASSQLGGTILPWVQGLLLAHDPAWGAAMTVSACLTMALLQLAFLRSRRGLEAERG